MARGFLSSVREEEKTFRMGFFPVFSRLHVSFLTKTLKFVSLGFVLAVSVLLVVLLLVPVPLNNLSRWAERQVEERFPGVDVEFGGIEALLSVREATLAVRMVDVRLRSFDGSSFGRVAYADLLFDIGVWLWGEGPSLGIRASDVSVGISRSPDGVFDIAWGGEVPLGEGLLGGVRSGFGNVRILVVENMNIHFVDERRGVTWRAHGRDMSFSQGALGVDVGGTLEVFSEYGNWTALLTSTPQPRDGSILVEAQVKDVPLADLGRFVSFGEMEERLEARGLKLNGYMSLSLSPEGAPELLRVRGESAGGEMKLPYMMEAFTRVEEVKLDLLARVDAGLYELHEFSYRHGNYRPQISGRVRVLEGGDIDLNLEARELFFGGVSAYESARLKARLEQGTRLLVLDEFSASAQGGDMVLIGRLSLSETQPAVHVQGSVRNMSLSALLPFGSFLPTPVVSFMESVPHVFLEEATANINLSTKLLQAYQQDVPFPEEAIIVDARFKDGVYQSPPPIKIIDQARGILMVRGRTSEIWIHSARLRGGQDNFFTVSEGHYRDVLGGPRAFNISFEGPSSSLLSMLQREGHFLDQGEFNLDFLEGESVFSASLSQGALKNGEREKLAVRGTWRLRDIEIPGITSFFDVTDGALDVDIDLRRTQIKGEIFLNGFPTKLTWEIKKGDFVSHHIVFTSRVEELDFFGGVVEVEGVVDVGEEQKVRGTIKADLTQATFSSEQLDWEKEAGEEAEAVFDLSTQDGAQVVETRLLGEDMRIEGVVSWDGSGRILRAQFPTIRLGEKIDLSFWATRDAQQVLQVEGEGRALDMRAFVSGMGGEGVLDILPEQGIQEWDIRLEQLHGHGEVVFYKTHFFARGVYDDVEKSLDFLEFRSFLAEEDFLEVSYKESPREDLDVYELLVHSSNAGDVLRGFGVYSQLNEGVLTLEVELASEVSPWVGVGVLGIEDFYMADAPVVTRILSLISPTGVVDLFGGKGLRFKQLHLPFFTGEGFVVEIGESWMTGSVVGLSFRGDYDYGEETVRLRGVATPFYGVTSLLGWIPVLGRFLTNQRGEGIVEVSFRVEGAVDAPSVRVNPLSALLPGGVRRVFRMRKEVPDISELIEAVPQ